MSFGKVGEELKSCPKVLTGVATSKIVNNVNLYLSPSDKEVCRVYTYKFISEVKFQPNPI